MFFSLKGIVLLVTIHLSICILIFISSSPHKNFLQVVEPSAVINSLENTIRRAEPKSILIPSKCKPHQSFYSPEEIKTIFKYQNYGPCITPTNDIISYTNNTLTIKCVNNSNPRYSFDESRQELFGGSKKPEIKWYNALPNLDSKQFLIIKCSKDSIYAQVFNRFNQKVSNSANEIRRKLRSNKKQMSVLLLVFDSISRFSFQRNLPKTAKFLYELKNNGEFRDDFDVYDFDKTPVPLPRTLWNMAQILYGKSWEELTKKYGSAYRFEKDEYYLKNQKKAIWSHFSSLGFVTMFSHNTVFDHLTYLFGRTIVAHHVFTNFWRYLWSIFNIHDIQDGQKCVGDRNNHDFSLDYTYQFFDNYKDNNKFAYVHLNAAHESTGNVRTIDEDLLRFLIKYLKMIQNRGENLGLFFCLIMGINNLKGPSGITGPFLSSIRQRLTLLCLKK